MNTSNIVFLKSTDDSMIETLSKMSGTMHVTYRDSKTVTKDVTAVMKMTANEGKVSYTMSTVERPVVAYNDFAQIPPCNSIVFRAGDLPIWNRNETALPMSWRLFKNTIVNPGKEYTLQTIPSLSTAKDFDVKQNQPNFTQMFEKRLNQAVTSMRAANYYKSVYGLTDDEIQRLDIDVYSDAIMEMTSQMLNPEVDMTKREEAPDKSVLDTEPKETPVASAAKPDDSVEKAMQNDPRIQKAKNMDRKIYACGTMSKSDLMTVDGIVSHAFDTQISAAYTSMWQQFHAEDQFRVTDNHDLVSRDGRTVYIRYVDMEAFRAELDKAGEQGGRVHTMHAADGSSAGPVGAGERTDLKVEDAFIRLLANYDTDWPFCAGRFAQYMSELIVNGSE